MSETIVPENSANPRAPKTPHKKLWITTAAVVGVFVVVGMAAPAVIGDIQHAQASSAFVSSEDAAEAAREDLAQAEGELATAKRTAADLYTAAKVLVDVTPVDRVADEAVLVEYTELLATHAEAAELELDDKLNVIVAEEVATEQSMKPAPVKTPLAIAALNSRAETFQAQADEYENAAKKARAQVEAIEAAYAPVPEQQLAIAQSAYVKGTELAGAFPALAAQAAKDTYNTAVAALAEDALTTQSDVPALVKTYVDAWVTVEASHAAEEARIAAEQAAAEESAREAHQNRGGGANINGGAGHNGGSHNGSNAGGGSTGGGSGASGGGSTVGGSTVGPRGQITRSSSDCLSNYGSGGGGSANWASNLVIPHNAVVQNISENPGVSWSVSFACDW